MIVWIIGALAIADALLMWVLCRIAGQSDEALERERKHV